MSSEEIIPLEDDEKDCILELLIQNAVDNNSQSALKLLKSLSFTDAENMPIEIDWDVEVGNIRSKIKAGV